MNTGSRLLIVCTFILLGGGGCAAIPLATLGTVLGSAGSAASAGSEAYSLGKLDFSVLNTPDECRTAAIAAAEELQLHKRACYFEDKTLKEWVIVLEDERHKTIAVRIDRRTGRLCQCRIDVGFFGSEPTAKLILQCMRAYLPKPAGQTDSGNEVPLVYSKTSGIRLFLCCTNIEPLIEYSR